MFKGSRLNECKCKCKCKGGRERLKVEDGRELAVRRGGHCEAQPKQSRLSVMLNLFQHLSPTLYTHTFTAWFSNMEVVSYE